MSLKTSTVGYPSDSWASCFHRHAVLTRSLSGLSWCKLALSNDCRPTPFAASKRHRLHNKSLISKVLLWQG